jgi:hypothetical protein
MAGAVAAVKRSNALALLAALVAAVLAPAGAARASSVRALDLRELLAGSELVFEGRVLSREAVAEPGSRVIHTVVRFAVSQVLKGASQAPVVELRFLGGSAGGRTLAVSDLYLPEPGETGVYFVERATGQVHPLSGWSQGHFVVRRDATGRERVLSRSGVPITALRAAAAGERAREARDLAPEAALGVTLEPGAPLEAAIELESFEALLRQLGAKAAP